VRDLVSTTNIQGGPKIGTILYALTLQNINRFSKLFHYQNQKKICNNTITKDPTTPQVCRYTTLWNVKCMSQHFIGGAIGQTSASLYPVSPPDNTFALPTEVFSSCLAIVSAVTVGGLILWPALRYGIGYQTVWDPAISRDSFRRFYFQLTCVHSAIELSGRCALQIHLLTYLLSGVASLSASYSSKADALNIWCKNCTMWQLL